MLTRAAGSILAIAMATALLAAPAVEARPGAGPGEHKSMSERMQKRLGLTAEQTQAVQEIFDRNRDGAREAAKAIGQARRELRHLALAGADDATIQAKTAQLADLIAESLRLRTRTLQEIAPLLSEEQRQKMEQLGHPGRGRDRHRPS
jgi:Spy/CpxP family protein refolding chaperone